MATENVIVNVVDVGQGQCTFVEIYDDSAKLVHTLLFDCGTDKSSDQTENNLRYIADKVSGMDTPAFDCIFFSHSDNDHISLTARLLVLCGDSPKPIIKRVIYGGNLDQYTKDGVNILNAIVEEGHCNADDVMSPGSYYSNYDPDEEKYTGTLWLSDDKSVAVVSLFCNVLSSRGKWKVGDDVPVRKSAVAKNMVSLVAGLYYAGSSHVICGDATGGTMGAVLKWMKGAPVFGNNVMTTLPHHGSRTTAGLAVKSAKRASLNAERVIRAFSKLLRSRTMSVSAYALHNHPSLELMNMFVPTEKDPYLLDQRLKSKDAHYLTANMDMELLLDTARGPGKRSRGTSLHTRTDTSFETGANTFTTRYFDSTQPRYVFKFGELLEVFESPGIKADAGAINGFASWQYTTSSAGELAIAGFSNLGAGAAFTSAALAALSESTIDVVKPSVRALRSARLRMPVPATPFYKEKLKQFN